jgi:hypothetical protein
VLVLFSIECSQCSERPRPTLAWSFPTFTGRVGATHVGVDILRELASAWGLPLAIQLTGANRNDWQQALSLVDSIPPLQGARGRPRHRPDCVLADRGYDCEAISARSACSPHHALARQAQYRTWQWTGPMEVGGRTNFRLAEPVSSAVCVTRSGSISMRLSWSLPVLSSAGTFSKGLPEACLGELRCVHVRLAIIWL